MSNVEDSSLISRVVGLVMFSVKVMSALVNFGFI